MLGPVETLKPPPTNALHTIGSIVVPAHSDAEQNRPSVPQQEAVPHEMCRPFVRMHSCAASNSRKQIHVMHESGPSARSVCTGKIQARLSSSELSQYYGPEVPKHLNTVQDLFISLLFV